MTNRGAAWILATAAFVALAGAFELLARSASTAAYVAAEPADLVSRSAYAAKLLAFGAAPSPKIALIGDSVALGQVMAGHGFRDWNRHELARALAAALERRGTTALVANFGANGLRPADEANLLLDAQSAGADAIVLVLGLRGFSAEFESPAQRFTEEWRSRPTRLLLERLWRTRAVADFFVEDWLGGPLSTLLSAIRHEQRAGGPSDVASNAVQMLLMKQRLSDVRIDAREGFQARALSQALRVVDARGAPVLAVYSTENPRILPQLMMPQNRDRGRAALKALICSSGNRLRYLGPDPTMTPDMYVDFIHLNPKGYAAMAERLAPELIRLLSQRGVSVSSTDGSPPKDDRCADG